MPRRGHSCRGEISVAFYKGVCYNTHQARQKVKTCRVRTSVVQRLPKPLRRVRLPYPAPKQTVIRKDDLLFWVPPPTGRLHPSETAMLGGSEFPLRQWFTGGKKLVRRICAAAQKGRLLQIGIGSPLMLLLLLSKSQPLTLGCDLVLGANLAAAASILVWVPPPKGGFTLRRLQCSGQVNCPCANGLPVQWFFIPIVLPKGGRFAIITVSRDSKTSSAAVRMYAAAAV